MEGEGDEAVTIQGKIKGTRNKRISSCMKLTLRLASINEKKKYIFKKENLICTEIFWTLTNMK